MDVISPEDKDLIIRTVIGEAGNQSSVGKAAVASVILNRIKSGEFGDSPQTVLFSKKQFEPWSTRSNELMAYSPDSPSYKKSAAIVDGILDGSIKDPTNGATHFANVDVVKKRGNSSALKWINGMENVTQIGDHTFGNANAGKIKMASADNYDDLIKEFGGAKETTPTASTENYSDLIKEFGGKEIKTEAAPTSANKVVAPPISGLTPEQSDARNAEIAKNPNVDASVTPNRLVKGVTSDLPFAVAGVPERFGKSLVDTFKSGQKTAGEGIADITSNRSMSGVAKTALGAIQMGLAPVSAASDVLIKQPVTEITGNPEIGNRTEFIATSGFPVAKAGKMAVGYTPSNQALKEIVKAVGPENIPAVIQQLRENPRLSLYDVSPAVQQMAQKLILTEGQHQNKFVSAINQRTATAKGAVNETLDATLGVPVNALEKINQMKKTAKETGSKLINPIVEKSGPAEVTNIVKSIDDAISAGGPVERKTLEALKKGEQPSLPATTHQIRLFKLREQLRGIWPDRDQMFIDVKGEQGAHKLQSSLRAEAQDLLTSADPKDRMLGKKLMDVRTQLVDAIDAPTGGAYKKALSKYRDDMQLQEAFDDGFHALNPNPRKMESRPEFFKDNWDKLSDAEKEAKREGARIAYDSLIRGYRSAPTNPAKRGTDLVQNEFNVENLKTMFGEKKANKMIKELNDEFKIADSNNKLLQGSQTAMRMKANASVDVPQRTGYGNGALIPVVGEIASAMAGGIPGAATTMYLVGKGAHFGKETAKINLAKRRNNQITNILTAEGPERDAILNKLLEFTPRASLSTRQKMKLLVNSARP